MCETLCIIFDIAWAMGVVNQFVANIEQLIGEWNNFFCDHLKGIIYFDLFFGRNIENVFMGHVHSKNNALP